jgi:hypothetical protein
MGTPKIQALGVVQEWTGTSWKATGFVEGIGWLEAWGKGLVEAMAALEALAVRRVAEEARTPPVDPHTPREQGRGEPGLP